MRDAFSSGPFIMKKSSNQDCFPLNFHRTTFMQNDISSCKHLNWRTMILDPVLYSTKRTVLKFLNVLGLHRSVR